MQMDLSSLFALGLFIAIEGLVLFYLKKDIEILKSWIFLTISAGFSQISVNVS